MVVYLDVVICLVVDFNGVFLMLGSYDCFLCFWSLDNKMCVQEIIVYCKKYEEVIYVVVCYFSKVFIVSVGVDVLVKVFV